MIFGSANEQSEEEKRKVGSRLSEVQRDYLQGLKEQMGTKKAAVDEYKKLELQQEKDILDKELKAFSEYEKGVVLTAKEKQQLYYETLKKQQDNRTHQVDDKYLNYHSSLIKRPQRDGDLPPQPNHQPHQTASLSAQQPQTQMAYERPGQELDSGYLHRQESPRNEPSDANAKYDRNESRLPNNIIANRIAENPYDMTRQPKKDGNFHPQHQPKNYPGSSIIAMNPREAYLSIKAKNGNVGRNNIILGS